MFGYIAQSMFVTEESQGSSSSQGLKRPLRKDAYWLAPRLTFSHISYTVQAYLPRNGTAHVG